MYGGGKGGKGGGKGKGGIDRSALSAKQRKVRYVEEENQEYSDDDLFEDDAEEYEEEPQQKVRKVELLKDNTARIQRHKETLNKFRLY